MGNKLNGPYKTMCVKSGADELSNGDMRDEGSDIRITHKQRSIKHMGTRLSENRDIRSSNSNFDPNSTYESQTSMSQIYDTRYWDRQYDNWQRGKGPKPGKHPDPECLWNTNPTDFNQLEYKT